MEKRFITQLLFFFCLAGSTVVAQTSPNFNQHIAPLLNEYCAACHHPGGAAPFSLLTYNDAKKRAKQIASNIKEELNNKLAEFATTVDNLEEVFENREQIEISKFYERLPKPTTTALEEFLESKIMYRRRSEEVKPEA